MEFKQNTLEHLQTKLVVSKAKSLPHGQFEAILSTDDLDRHGEHVSITGLSIPKDQTIKMYWNHETTGMALPIGKWLKVWKKDGKLMGHGEIDLEDDFALKVYKKLLKGIIDSISIGFYPLEYDGDTATWTKSTLVEGSLVGEPANVNAVVTQKDLGFTPKEFKKALIVKMKSVAEDLENDEADPPEEKSLTVQIHNKGEVEDVLTTPKKWEVMKPYYDVIYAFETAFYDSENDVSEFPKLLGETIALLQKIVDGTYEYTDKDASDENGANDAELKAVIEDLKSKVGALEAANLAANESPATKKLIQVRVLGKEVDKSAEALNRVIKVKLKDSI